MNYKKKESSSGTVTEYVLVFLLGACAYIAAELIYRGYSHITMFFAGGLCFFLIYICEKKLYYMKIVYRCIIYALMITAVEFVFGVVFNIMLGMQVWDYSGEPFNILGQVCPGFVLMWLALSFPAMFICRKLATLFEAVRREKHDNALDK